MREWAGIEANLGKCRMWNRGGFEPAGHLALGTDVWVGGANTPEERRGLKVLGTPLGTTAFAARLTQERTDEERNFLRELPNLPDLQCAWALLLYFAVPRCSHVLRTLPPSLSRPYAEAHDRSLQEALMLYVVNVLRFAQSQLNRLLEPMCLEGF